MTAMNVDQRWHTENSPRHSFVMLPSSSSSEHFSVAPSQHPLATSWPSTRKFSRYTESSAFSPPSSTSPPSSPKSQRSLNKWTTSQGGIVRPGYSRHWTLWRRGWWDGALIMRMRTVWRISFATHPCHPTQSHVKHPPGLSVTCQTLTNWNLLESSITFQNLLEPSSSFHPPIYLFYHFLELSRTF